jgi:putative DNA-invertase from lambdoid prophage Rac
MNPKPTKQGEKAFIYTRVSTNRQNETGHSLESQAALLTAEATKQGYQVELIVEVMSASKGTRPKLREALADLKAGKAQALFCLDMDRLGRSAIELLQIAEKAKKEKWKLWITNLGGDISASAGGRLTFGILAQVAEMESSLISERVARQHEARRERGITWGVDQGYKGNLNPQARRLIAKWNAEGYTLREIALKLTQKKLKPPAGGLWYANTIRQILLSPQTKTRKQVA